MMVMEDLVIYFLHSRNLIQKVQKSFGVKMNIKAGIIAVSVKEEVLLTKQDHHFILLGKDGQFEYLNGDDICKLIGRYYPLEIEKAAEILILEAQKFWKQSSLDTHDIKFILIFKFT
ncbi:unnamed protein product [Paramecium sonneborni]|uniref:PPM-type phosphatase domain-containing protein n=1 Tax=Paramecium sonneborni TaxID=65129 RepID=A0A8S1KV34_9CILI|nr:unnamed protein product [Paramecium sonneborni]